MKISVDKNSIHAKPDRIFDILAFIKEKKEIQYGMYLNLSDEVDNYSYHDAQTEFSLYFTKQELLEIKEAIEKVLEWK